MATTGPGQFGVQTSMNAGPILQGFQQINAAAQNTTRNINTMNATAQRTGNIFQNLFNRPAQQLIFLGLDLQQLGRSLAVLSAPFIAADGAATKFALDFQDALRDINSLIHVSDAELERLGDRLRTLALDPQVVQGPKELATALKFLLSSGFDTANAFGVLRAAAVGATAGNADLTTVTRLTAGVLNALPRGAINAGDAMDTMFQTVKDGIIEFNELASTAGEVINSLGISGVSFKEFGAAVATLTRAGVPADETMTSLNNIILQIIAPSKQAADTAASLGIEFNASALQAKGLAGVLADVNRATLGNAETLHKLFDERRAFRGVSSLLRNDEQDFLQLLDSQSHASDGLGAATEALNEQLKKPGVQLKLLKRDIESAGISSGEDFLPLVVAATKILRDLALGFASLDPATRNFVIGLGIATAGAGAFFFSLGTLFTALGALKNLYITLVPPVIKAAGALRTFAAASAAASAAQAAGGLAGAAGVGAAGAAARVFPTAGAFQAAAVTGVLAAAPQIAAVTRNALGQVTGITARNALGQVISTTAATAAAQAASQRSTLATLQAIQAQQRAATATAQLNATLVANAGASAVAAGGLRTVAAAGLRLLGWVAVIAVVAEVANILLDFAANARVAGKSADELAERITELQKIQQGGILRARPQNIGEEALAALPGAGPVLLFQSRQKELAKAKEALAGQIDPLAKFAIQEATQANEEAIAAANKDFAQKFADFDAALAKSAQFPETQKQIQEARDRLAREGPTALVTSGFETLSPQQQKAVVQRLDDLFAAAQAAVRAGNEGLRNELFAQIEDIQTRTGFNIQVPVSLQAITQANIDAINAQINDAQVQARAASLNLTQALVGLEKQQRANQFEQLKLNLLMFDAQAAFKAAQDAVNGLEEQLRDAQDRLNNFGQRTEIGVKVVLKGLPEIEDQIFEIGQRVASIQLQILDAEAQFTPALFDAQEEVLRTRLALLQAGDAAESLGKKASFGIEDLISAQQRELREGVPVLRTIFEKIQQAAAGGGGEGADQSPQQQAANAAQRRLEILQTEQQLATINLRRQEEIAQTEERRVSLVKQLTFDAQLRDLAKFATILKEVTFEEAKQGIIESRDAMISLNEKLLGANEILKERRDVVSGLDAQENDLRRRALELQIELTEKQNALADIQADLAQKMAEFQVRIDEQQQIANARGVPSAANAPLTQRVDVGNEFPIAFTHEQQQASNDQIRAIQFQTLQGLNVADEVIGGIVDLFQRLLSALGTAVAESRPDIVPQFHSGGPVAPALPAGTEVSARLQAGEYVLSRQDVAQIARGSASSPKMLSSPSENWNWNVIINNSSGAGDPYAKLLREVHMRRFRGRW